MDEYDYDEINGSYGKKSKLALLNKKKVHPFEMDELFLEGL